MPSVPVFRFLIFGAVIWFLALLFIRFSGGALFSTQTWMLPALFVCTIPGSAISIPFCLRLGKTSVNQAVPAVALISLAALLLDGLVFTWYPQAYGTDMEAVRLGAAWLLWAVGVFLADAFLIARWAAR